jgi:hypothetical protein
MNDQIGFVHIHDEYHSVVENQSYHKDIHSPVYLMYDHYYNYHLIMERISKIKKKEQRFNIDFKLCQLYLNVYSIILV